MVETHSTTETEAAGTKAQTKGKKEAKSVAMTTTNTDNSKVEIEEGTTQDGQGAGKTSRQREE